MLLYGTATRDKEGATVQQQSKEIMQSATFLCRSGGCDPKLLKLLFEGKAYLQRAGGGGWLPLE